MSGISTGDKRVWISGGVIVAILLAAAAWFLVIHPELASATQTKAQTADVDQRNTIEAQKVAALAQQNKNIGRLRADLVSALEGLPSSSGLPAFTRELTAVASRTSVNLRNITVGQISPVAAVVDPATVTASPTDSPSPSPSPSSTDTASPAVPATPVASQFSIGITLTADGTLQKEARFIHLIENGPRRAIMNSSLMTASGGARIYSLDSTSTMTLQLTIFSAPMNETQVAQLKKLLTGS